MHIILKRFFYYFVLSVLSNYLCENFYIGGISFKYKERKILKNFERCCM